VAERPLEGRRIVVTRPRPQAQELASALEVLGASVQVSPLVATGAVADPSVLEEAVRDLDGYDWVVLTSATGVDAIGERAPETKLVRVAAVGPATARALDEIGLGASFVPERYAAEEIAPGLEPLQGARVLVLQADIAEPDLVEELRRRGAIVDTVAAYRTVEVDRPAAELAELRTADAVVLASGSAARSLARQGGAGAALVVCIGPKTADIAREAGLPPGLVAREATAEGIIQALTTHFGGRE
jgi:uroporphyrinogen III methyltransferase / synthase